MKPKYSSFSICHCVAEHILDSHAGFYQKEVFATLCTHCSGARESVSSGDSELHSKIVGTFGNCINLIFSKA